jgi:hypothetical protein
MSYTKAITDLRQMLSDTILHKKATGKKLIGKVDGNNTVFYTYDKRISEETVEVMVNGEAVSFSVDDAIQGKITLGSAPDINSKVVANYYFTWWIDDELVNFLNKGAESTGQFTDTVPDDSYLKIIPGLRTAALYFACSMATNALVNLLMNRRHSEEFLVEQDGNDDSNFSSMIDALRRQSKDYWDRACWHRDDFYKRLGKRNAPAFGVKTVPSRKYGAIR